jgi:hypothetical protein
MTKMSFLSWQFQRQKNLINFAKISEVFLRFWKFENSKFSENYKNITSNSNFSFREKTVPTWIFDQIAENEFRMQGPT